MKKPIDKILVPLDHSETAFHAAWIALAIAKAMQASLTLFHIHIQEQARRETILIGAEQFRELSDETYSSLILQIVGDLSAEHLKAAFKNSVVEIESASFSRADEICDFAASHNVDLIIISANVHSKIHDLLWGNVTAKVAEHAPCSVLVVR